MTQSYDKTPTPTENSKTNGQHKNATKIFDYTKIEDRRRTASWSNNSLQTSVVKPVNGYPTFPLTAKAVLSKGHTFETGIDTLYVTLDIQGLTLKIVLIIFELFLCTVLMMSSRSLMQRMFMIKICLLLYTERKKKRIF